MRRIPGYPVWIGHRGDLLAQKAINAAGISFLVDLAIDEPVPQVSRELTFARFPLYDGAGNEAWLVRAAIDTCVLALRNNQNLMVMCSSGLSRSPSIAAAAISLYSGEDPAKCLRLTTAECGDVSPGLWTKILEVL